MNDELKGRLLSHEIETQAGAIDECLSTIRDLADTAIRGLLTAERPFILSYELAKFGPVVVPGLEELLKEAQPGEALVCISLLLLSFGSHSGVEIAIEEVRSGGGLIYAAASALGDAGILRAGPVIVERLRQLTATSRFDPKMSGAFSTFCSAMKKLGVEMPDDIRETLLEEGGYLITRSWAEEAAPANRGEN